MAAPLILARTFKDAHAFARDVLGLSFGYYRVVNSPGTIKAVRNVDLYLVPGWDKRPDRFTMKSAIKWSRQNVIDVAAQAQEPETRYANDDKTRTIAERYNALRDLPAETSNMLEVENDPEGTDFFEDLILEDAPEPTATCVDCGLDPHDPECFSAEPPVVDHQQGELNVPEETEAPKKRRRSKCKTCGNLHYKDEPCPTEAD